MGLISTRPELKRLRLFNPLHLAAVGFGSGLMRFAPGTCGTVAAIPMWIGLSQLPLTALYLVVLLSALFGWWCCQRATDALGIDDHPAIVWDEFVGYFVTMLFAPETSWVWVLLGFVLFRLFDITKPWPIKRIDRDLHGGLGIMLDDILAGVMAGVCLLGIQSLTSM